MESDFMKVTVTFRSSHMRRYTRSKLRRFFELMDHGKNDKELNSVTDEKRHSHRVGLTKNVLGITDKDRQPPIGESIITELVHEEMSRTPDRWREVDEVAKSASQEVEQTERDCMSEGERVLKDDVTP